MRSRDEEILDQVIRFVDVFSSAYHRRGFSSYVFNGSRRSTGGRFYSLVKEEFERVVGGKNIHNSRLFWLEENVKEKVVNSVIARIGKSEEVGQ